MAHIALPQVLHSAVASATASEGGHEWRYFARVDDTFWVASKNRAGESVAVILAYVGRSAMKLAVKEFGLAQELSARDANDLYARLAKEIPTMLDPKLSLDDQVVMDPSGGIDPTAPGGRGPVLNRFVNRFAGALVVEGDYEQLRGLIWEVCQRASERVDSIASYKTELQEYLQPRGTSVTYKTVSATGPAHAQRFIVQAVSSVGEVSCGEGRSKKEAGEAAARSFLETFAPRHLANRRRAVGARTRRPSLPTSSEAAKVAQLFGVDAKDASVFVPIVMHRTIGSPELGSRANVLAQVGKSALEVLVSMMLLRELETRTDWLAKMTAHQGFSFALRDTASARCSELLGLEKHFKRGRDVPLTERLRSDLFEGAVGAAVAASGSVNRLVLPDPAETYLTTEVRRAISGDRSSVLDAKTRLQELLASARCTVSYSSTWTGPPHNRQFKGAAVLTKADGVEFSTSGGEGRTARESQVALAERLVRVHDQTHRSIGNRVDAKAWPSVAKALGRWFLDAALECTRQPDRTSTPRMANAGLLGAPLLVRGDLDQFERWAEAATELLELPDGVSIVDEAASYYGYVSGISASGVSPVFAAAIAAIRDLVATLDPQDYKGDLLERREFLALLDLGVAVRLATRPWRLVRVADVIADVALLRRAKSPSVLSAEISPDLWAAERRGALRAVVDELVSLMGRDGSVVITAASADRRITIQLRADQEAAKPALRQFTRRPLWRYVREQLPAWELSEDGTTLVLSVPRSIPKARNRGLLIESTTTTMPEMNVLARILHDLKNQLVAFHVALTSNEVDRTTRLRSQLEASERLDEASALSASLGSLSEAVADPVLETVEIGQFFREYVAEKYRNLPSAIEFRAPGRSYEATVTTDLTFHRSILDNLIKNAVEAMPAGGGVRLDWRADEPPGMLTIDVADDGSGVTSEQLEDLLKGSAQDSHKPGGSGLGMLGVVSMVRRLGGVVSGTLPPSGGTCWRVELPTSQVALEELVGQ